MKLIAKETKLLKRENLIKSLNDQGKTWDLLVIGGGATGLGIALDAISRGYETLLVEQSDFAKGTSSRSTKLVHGGVRYLAQGDAKLVREASIERGLLCRNASHLVKNQTFIIPIYSYWDRLKYTIGLKLYDWIAGRLSLGSSVFISKKKTIEALPGVKTEGLLGGVMYHDGQFDDARLALNLVQTIHEKGGTAINYLRVKGLKKNAAGKLEGASLQDAESGEEFQIRAKAIVNATGVFVDDILNMDNPSGSKLVCVSQGVHLVLDKKFYPSAHALMIPETSDGRVLFAVPWHGKVVVGTTDTPVQQASLEPKALDREIDFILNTAAAYLAQQPQRSDVLSVFAGLRPLAAPKDGEQKTKEISRSHKIITSTSGLFTMLGGKWTTFRKMGEDMVDHIEKHMGWNRRKSTSASLAIHGSVASVNWKDPFYFYGSDAIMLKKQIREDGQWLSEKLQIHAAQVEWAVKHEMARTVEDFLSRRTRALLLDAEESIRISPQVAGIMAALLGKDQNWIRKELIAYNSIAQQYLLVKPAAALQAEAI